MHNIQFPNLKAEFNGTMEPSRGLEGSGSPDSGQRALPDPRVSLREEAAMKKAMLIGATLVCAAGSLCAADLPQVGYIGIFTDTTHFVGDPPTYPNPGNTVCPGEFSFFFGWIWCLPSAKGMHGAEFALSCPPAVRIDESGMNPAISEVYGHLPWQEVSVTFSDGMCQMDWVWLFKLQCVCVDVQSPMAVGFTAHQFANCDPGYPMEPCICVTPLYICPNPSPGPIAVRRETWGTIKELYR
jgi:hypothetical protein